VDGNFRSHVLGTLGDGGIGLVSLGHFLFFPSLWAQQNNGFKELGRVNLAQFLVSHHFSSFFSHFRYNYSKPTKQNKIK